MDSWRANGIEALPFLAFNPGRDKLRRPTIIAFEASGQAAEFILYTGLVALAVARAQVAQLVEQWTENPRVGGSSPPLGTIYSNNILIYLNFVWIRRRG